MDVQFSFLLETVDLASFWSEPGLWWEKNEKDYSLDEGENLRFLSIKKTERLKMSNEKEYFEKNFVANCLYEG